MEQYSGQSRLGIFCFFLWGCLGMTGFSLSLQSIYQVPLDPAACSLIGSLSFLCFCLLFRKKTALFGGMILLFLAVGVSVWNPSFWRLLPRCFPVFAAFLFQRFEQSGMIVLFSLDSREILRGLSYADRALCAQAALICLLVLSGAVFACCLYFRQHPLALTLYCALFCFPYWTYQFAPSLFAGRILLAFLLSSYAVRFVGKKPPFPNRSKGKNAALRVIRESTLPKRAAAGFCAILLFFSFYGVSFFSYLMPRTPWVNYSAVVESLLQLQVNLKNLTARLPFDLDFSFGGGVNGGKIGGSFHPLNVPVMDVESDSSAPLYLRAWIGHNYEYGRWSPFDQSDQEDYISRFGEDSFPEFSMQSLVYGYGEDGLSGWFDFSTVRIYNVRTGGNLVFFPSIAYAAKEESNLYGLEPWMDGMAFTGGQALQDTDMTFRRAYPRYERQTFPYFLEQVSVENYENSHYRIYAEDQYLAVPSQLEERLSSLAREITQGLDDDYSRVVAIQDYLKTHYSYTTEPKDGNQSDPVAYFLFDSKKGYCAHYASAMVLLTRALGIPARYVEGYAVSPQAGGATTVMDSNAHSWPEVYFPRVGWLPFEPTTGYNASTPSPGGETRPSAPTSTEPVSSAGTSSFHTSSMPPSASNAAPATSSSPSKPAPDAPLQPGIIAFAACAAVILLAFAGLALLSLHWKRIRKIPANSPETVQKLAAFMLRQLESLGMVREDGELPSVFAARVDARFRGKFSPSFQDCVALILKDRFSAGSLTREETEQVFLCAKQLDVLLSQSVHPVKRFWYRHILHLLGPGR